MRASRILSGKPDRALVVLAQLCEEREEESMPVSAHPYANIRPHLPAIPPQVPYTVGSSQHAPVLNAPADIKTPPRRLFEPLASSTHERKSSIELVEGGTPLLQHMAPTRGKWTSPPPPDAPPAVQDSYKNSLGLGLSLATSSTAARETKDHSPASSSASDAPTEDELRSDASGSHPPSPHSSSEPGTAQQYASRRGESPMRLHLGKQSVPDLSEAEGPSPKATPKASQLTYPPRAWEVEKADAGPSVSTPTKNAHSISEPPAVLPANPRRSSSGPPSLRSPPLTDDAAPLPSSTTTGVSINGHANPKHVPSLTLDTGDFSRASPSGSPPNEPLLLTDTTPRTAWPEFISHPYVPPCQARRHSRNPSGSSSRHHHSASSGSQYPVTLYRTQPQATTFPLYQQVSSSQPPSTFASTSSSPYLGSPTYEPVQYGPNDKRPSKSPTTINGKPQTPNHSNTASVSTSPEVSNPQSTHLTSTPESPVVSTPVAEKTESLVKTKSHTLPKSSSTPAIENDESSIISPVASGTKGASRNPSVIRKKYDPSAAFRIPTTTTIVVGMPPPSPESARSSTISTASPPNGGRHGRSDDAGSSPTLPRFSANKDSSSGASRRGTDASLSSSAGSATSGGADVPEAMFVWPSVR